MRRVALEELAGHADGDFVFGCNRCVEVGRECGGGAAEQNEEIPWRGCEGGDVEVRGLDDKVSGLRCDDDFDGWS